MWKLVQFHRYQYGIIIIKWHVLRDHLLMRWNNWRSGLQRTHLHNHTHSVINQSYDYDFISVLFFSAIIHGDFRLDNVIFHPTQVRVIIKVETSLIRTLQNKDTSITGTTSIVPNIALSYLWNEDTSLIRTLWYVPMVSTIERFHCNYYNYCILLFKAESHCRLGLGIEFIGPSPSRPCPFMYNVFTYSC